MGIYSIYEEFGNRSKDAAMFRSLVSNGMQGVRLMTPVMRVDSWHSKHRKCDMAGTSEGCLHPNR